MKLNLQQEYSGFVVKAADYIEEVQSEAYLLEHTKSGARLLYLANDDDNKVFSISFRTPPYDDTGIAHILEHSSLCGSRKYPLKEPFVELVKGSLNTFLNAMTYPDKTMYPVASRNNQDFRNLMDVYLDAVFYPLIYENKFTLLQEGWHYEIAKPEDKLEYNGVVYNEMKGVFSSAEAVGEFAVMRELFPDTPYRYESGGYPDAIPQLTQKAFEKFHATYYSPENSYIYLYGDLDIEDALAYLDKDYLSHFSKTGTVDSEIPLQQTFNRTKEVEAVYPLGEDETTEGKTYHELNIVCGEATDVKLSVAMRLLESVLLEGNNAPLRLALLQSGICMDAYGQYTSSLRQPLFSIKIAGSEPEKCDEFVNIIYKTLQDLTINGIEKELLEANLNSLEFKLREADFGAYPKGLIYGISVMETWLYGGDPFDGIKYNELLKSLRAGINEGYFERLIEEYLLDNTHKVLLTLKPQPGLEKQEQAASENKLSELKSTMSSAQLDEYCALCEELHIRQAKTDSMEALASIPLLKRSDLQTKVDVLTYEEHKEQQADFIYMPAFTNKITYLAWYFDVSGLSKEYLPYCYLLSDMLGKVDTEQYTYQELATAASKYTGGIGFQLQAFSAAASTDEYVIKFVLKAKVLTEKLDKLFDILFAVTNSSKFDNKKRLREILSELKSDWDSNFFARGQTVACARLVSYFSASGRVNEQDYYSYYEFIKNLNDNFDEQADTALGKLQQLLSYCFHNNGYLLTYACDKSEQPIVLAKAKAFAEKLGKSPVAAQPVVPFTMDKKNEGIMTPGKVQYVVAGGDFVKHGYRFTGAMKVLETILRYEYLWTKVRVQGGAYGAAASFDRNGTMYFSSYRDPKLVETFAVYNALPEWLAKLELSERELTKYVIGTVSGLTVPLTNSMRLAKIAVEYIKQISPEMRQKSYDEVLQLQLEDLRALAPVVSSVLADGYICVVGGAGAIEAAKEQFDSIQNM